MQIYIRLIVQPYCRAYVKSSVTLSLCQLFKVFYTLKTADKMFEVWQFYSLSFAFSPANRGATAPHGLQHKLHIEALPLIFFRPACSLENQTLLRCTAHLYCKVEAAISVKYSVLLPPESIKSSFYNHLPCSIYFRQPWNSCRSEHVNYCQVKYVALWLRRRTRSENRWKDL